MAGEIMDYFGNAIVGQQRIRELLAESFHNERAAHAYLFSGKRGIGKAAIALEFAMLLLCESPSTRSCGECIQCKFSYQLQHPDLHLIFPLPPAKSIDDDDFDNIDDLKEDVLDAINKLTKEIAKNPYYPARVKIKKKADDRTGKIQADRILVGQIRSLLKTLSRKPMQAKRKVSVIFHADSMNEQAQNILLKGLEEPPQEGYFLLITENEKKLLPTIRSRCQRLFIPPLTYNEILDNLMQKGIDRHQAEAVAILSQGSLVKANELLSPELEILQGKVFDFLAEAFICNPLNLFKIAEELTETDNFPPNTGLELLSTLLKDIAIMKASPDISMQKLSFAKYRARIEKFLTACPNAEFETAVSAVEQAMNQIESGYTKTIVLLGLAIKIQAALKTHPIAAA